MASAAAAAKVALDMLFYCVVCCVLCVTVFLEQVRITVCLLRFGVNGSFYLNPKKSVYVDWYRT
jgi:hypothetical protein